MSKFLSSILFSLFLLFQTSSLGDEYNEDAQENVVEEESEAPEATEAEEAEPQEEQEDEPKEEMSEAQKEAQAAEEAELREAGMGEEPLID